MKILIVEDDRKIVNFLRAGLQSEGYAVTAAADGADGLERAVAEKYDMIILDLLLPKLDGLSLCRELRRRKVATPIIMLTAKETTDDRVSGLQAGADDYLTKPFSFAELLARIKAIARRSQGSSAGRLAAGDLTLDPDTLEAQRAGKPLKLSATEFKLLKYLLENQNRVISKPLILENVWGYDFDPESNIVEVYIKYLRDKIDKGHKKSLIQTVHGIGYKLCA
ncbi:MAG TPA: response regulator transcription factor [Candidatus Sulfotelmatobacter sp.]|nr:response regulator transcription factor [Candidatus Sulfotelmatobacter sp.]